MDKFEQFFGIGDNKTNINWIDTLSARLISILSDMDVPELRKDLTEPNIRWLQRNLPDRNSGSPNFQEAMDIIVELLKNK